MKMHVIALLLCAPLIVAENRPDGISVSTWVREDLFAGFMVNDWVRFEQGQKKLDAILTATPDAPDALAWKGGAELALAVKAHESGNKTEFEQRYGRAKEIFAQARNAAGEAGALEAVYAISGGSWTHFADRLPHHLQKEAWEQGNLNYSALRKAQDKFFLRLPVHMKGEVLAGLAQASQRLGKEDELRARLEEVIKLLPDTPYASRARRWQENPAVAAKTSMVCQTCHDQGRLEPAIARLKKK